MVLYRIAPVLLLLGVLGCAPRTNVQPLIPVELDYLDREAWGASDPVLPMQQHTPSRITIHHTATYQNRDRSLADKMRALQEFSQTESALGDGRIKEPWADIPYHFYVDVHGSVAEGRSLEYAGDSNTPYDPSGHILIVLEGNFEEEEVTPAQRRAMDLLVTEFAKRFTVTPDLIGAHKDFAPTLCPGENLYAEMPRLRSLIE